MTEYRSIVDLLYDNTLVSASNFVGCIAVFGEYINWSRTLPSLL